jgi:hypothetical protein
VNNVIVICGYFPLFVSAIASAAKNVLAEAIKRKRGFLSHI